MFRKSYDFGRFQNAVDLSRSPGWLSRLSTYSLYIILKSDHRELFGGDPSERPSSQPRAQRPARHIMALAYSHQTVVSPLSLCLWPVVE